MLEEKSAGITGKSVEIIIVALLPGSTHASVGGALAASGDKFGITKVYRTLEG